MTVAAVAALLAAFSIGIYFANPTRWSLAVGLALIGLGLAIRLITNAVLKKNEETSRDGLYALCRHPMYVGTLTLAAGIAVAFNHPAGLALFAVALATSLYRIRKEERFLLLALPDYDEYRRDVPAFPTPGSVRRALAGRRLYPPLSLRQCFLNGEVRRLNLYLPLILASGFYLQVPDVVLGVGAALALLVTLASIRLHPADRRGRGDYLLPGVLVLMILGLVLLARI